MAKLECKIEVQDIDKVSALIDLLDRYQDQLPDELVSALHDLADCEYCEINESNLCLKTGLVHPIVMADGERIEQVVSVNTVTKVVAYADLPVRVEDGQVVMKKIKAETVTLIEGDKEYKVF